MQKIDGKWKQDIALLSSKIIRQITPIITNEEYEYYSVFTDLLIGLRSRLGNRIVEDDIIELICQYIITKPIFTCVFPQSNITNKLNESIELVVAGIEVDLSMISGFYTEVENRAVEIESNAEKQEFITHLYGNFFNAAFPRMCSNLGIVYTPIEVVDFIIKSVDDALRNEFGVGIGDSSVEITDPFTGTGLFIARLIQSDLISDHDLPRKYKGEIHANEIVPLAYMLAGINIENSYRERTGDREPFPGLELVDTFLT